jgi:putative salt-induced outer membrane protein YdiY
VRTALVVALALVVLAAPRLARAQIVNVQSLLGQETPEGFSGALDAGADWRTGNTELLILSGASTLRYKSGDHLVFAVARAAYGRIGSGDDEKQIIGNTFEHVRYRWRLGDRLTAETFGQHELDKFRRLKLRALAGVGPRLSIFTDKQAALVFGVAYMFEYERLDDKVGTIDAGADYTTQRMSTYLVFTSALNDVVTFAETVYLQPNLADLADFRLLNETQLQVKLTDHFTFKTALVIAHDASPPDTVKKTDTSMQTGISFKF